MSAAFSNRASRRGLRAAGLGLLPAVGLALAACAPGAADGNPALGWTEASSPKELEVNRATYRHPVRFATDSAEVDAIEQDRLLRFLATIDPTEQDTVRIEGHADERAGDLYNLGLSARRAARVLDFLRAHGLSTVEMRPAAYGEQVPAAPGSTPESLQANRRVEVVIDRYAVVLPPCPDWSMESGRDYANLPHTNLGCATRTNLGLMIADPRDLEHGRDLGPADATREAEAIVRYRTGEVTPLKEEEVD